MRNSPLHVINESHNGLTAEVTVLGMSRRDVAATHHGPRRLERVKLHQPCVSQQEGALASKYASDTLRAGHEAKDRINANNVAPPSRDQQRVNAGRLPRRLHEVWKELRTGPAHLYASEPHAWLLTLFFMVGLQRVACPAVLSSLIRPVQGLRVCSLCR